MKIQHNEMSITFEGVNSKIRRESMEDTSTPLTIVEEVPIIEESQKRLK